MGLLGLTSLGQDSKVTTQGTMAELGLKKKEIDAIEFAFDVYDFKGDGKVDAFYAGDLIRACNLNPTLKTVTEIGGGQAKGTKFLGKADIFPMYKACKDSKDQGGFHDFVEILKLYDKNGDDTMIGNELFRLLTNLGEKLTKEEAKALMKELCEPENEEASWSSNLSSRGCALLRSKRLPVLSYLYCTVLCCTLQYSTVLLYSTKQQWNLAFLPRKVPGVTLPPKLPFAANFCGC